MNLIKNKNDILPFALIFLLSAILVYFKHDYLFGRFIIFIGLMFTPFIVRQILEEKSIKYGILSMLSGCVLFFENSNMAFYFCAGFGLLFIWEYFKGRLNYLPFYLLIIISPVFQYIADVWSFPIRMGLSQLAGKVLSIVGMQAEVAGNMVILNGDEFLVDPACMGLNMLSVSLLLVLVMMARKERKNNSVFSFHEIGAWMVLALALSIFSNFNRLLALVLFKILPGNPMHDVWGIVSLFTFVLIPIYFLLEKRRTIEFQFGGGAARRTGVRRYIDTLILIFVFTILLFHGNTKNENNKNVPLSHPVVLEGFEKSIGTDGLIKLANDSLLIYLKPPTGFLRASHDPRICWRGSGYEFRQVDKTLIKNMEVYTAKMKKGDDYLYTVWWYDNGQEKTVEEWEWRWQSLLGNSSGYFMINMTGADKKQLFEQVGSISEKLVL